MRWVARAVSCVCLAAMASLSFLALAPVGQAGAADSQDFGIQVDLAHGFTPPQAAVSTGRTVVWTNNDKLDYPGVRGAHTVVADDGSFGSPEIPPGASWSFSFLSPGTYSYHCSIHPNLLHGTVAVTGPKVEPPKNQMDVAIVEPKGSVENAGFAPKDVIGTPGLTITWRNQGAQAHTVTVDGGFDSGEIPAGKTYTHTFPSATAVSYYCTLHPWMKGSVRIAAPGSKPPPLPPPAQKKGSGTSLAASTPSQPVRGSGPVTLRVNVVEQDAANPQSWGFAPTQLQARVGDTVIWTNTGAAPHTVTASSHQFDSGTLGSAATFAFTPVQVGSVSYFCTFHPWMKGTVDVLPKGSSSTAVLGQKFSKSPAPSSSSVSGGASPDTAPVAKKEASRKGLAGKILGVIFALFLLIVIPGVLPRSRKRSLPPEQSAPVQDEERERHPVGV